jgi:unsaturated chondroitin disaccharide hydrolase
MEFIIDNGEVMDLLWWAGQENECYRRMARNTLTKLAKLGFVKPDGSTLQCLSLDPKTYQPLEFYTRQGYSDESCWARGQAWAMISFSTAYEATGDKLFLEKATLTADWYVYNLPEDYIPFYDFHDPRIPQIARDTSAATIACCAFSMLKNWLPERAKKYQQVIDESVRQMLARYLTPGGILMGGTWGSLLRSDPPEVVMPYGNYYIVELAYRELNPSSELFSFQK